MAKKEAAPKDTKAPTLKSTLGNLIKARQGIEKMETAAAVAAKKLEDAKKGISDLEAAALAALPDGNRPVSITYGTRQLLVKRVQVEGEPESIAFEEVVRA